MPRHTPLRRELYQSLRARARDAALQALYQDDINPKLNPAVTDEFLHEELSLAKLVEAARPRWVEFAREELPGHTAEELARMSPDELLKLAWDYVVDFAQPEELTQFARSLVVGVRLHRAELDQQFERLAENWSLHRMAVTDRNVLRLGAFEILHTDTPGPVAINEAVELANRFGTAQSGPFVNGILDKVLHEKNKT
jgi:transcription antitermination protein NusB